MSLYFIALFWLTIIVPLSAMSAPYAAMVMDARTGKVLHASNADTRLHPASLTKMMTLYVAFEAVQNGELTMDSLITVSKLAASEPPSKLGLRAGQKIKLRYLVRAAAVKSANDAATAIAEGISGSEAAFARRMNRTAKALGMTRTTFRNAHGLTEDGHLSTAHDMTILGRHVIYDYPEYYNLFSRRTADAGVRTVAHTNTRLLNSYKGADGIKTGYTRAAGFNLVASAERGNERVIATVFGGRSTASRNARVAELLDLGFQRSPSRVAFAKPRKPAYQGNDTSKTVIVTDNGKPAPTARAKSIRVANAAVTRSLRPMARAVPEVVVADIKPPDTEGLQEDILNVLEQVQVAAVTPAPAPTPKPARSETVAEPVALQVAAQAPVVSPKPVNRPKTIVAAAPAKDKPTPARAAEVIERVSTSGGRHWGINLGRYQNHFAAEKVLLTTALSESATLDGALRKVVKSSRGFDANFVGLSRETADLACRKLQARQVTCFMIGPS